MDQPQFESGTATHWLPAVAPGRTKVNVSDGSETQIGEDECRNSNNIDFTENNELRPRKKDLMEMYRDTLPPRKPNNW